MLHKISLIFIITLFLLGCATVKVEDISIITRDKIISNNKEIPPKDVFKIRTAISDNVLAKSDPYFSDFATLVLDLIRNKKWEFISELTKISHYNDYVIDNNGSFVDYCMFMLHTGDEGISTNQSLNNIINAFYTDSYFLSNKLYYEGIYIFPDNETEFFKIVIEDTNIGLVITRE